MRSRPGFADTSYADVPGNNGHGFFDIAWLRDGLPALADLKAIGARRLRHFQQMTSTDCGPAVLMTVLAHFGRHVGADEVRRLCRTGRGGTTALSLMRAARCFGLHARSVRLGTDALTILPRSAILHWDCRHYVVFDRVTRRGVRIVDPACGHRIVSMESFQQSFSGVALCFEPGPDFTRGTAPNNRFARYAPMLRAHAFDLALVLVISLLLRALALLGPVFTGLIVDRVIGRGERELIAVLATGAVGILTFQVCTTLLRAHLTLNMRTRMDSTMTRGFVDHLVRLPYEYFESRDSGDLMVRMSSNSRVKDILTNSVISTLIDGTLALLYLAVLFIGSARLAWIAVAIGTCRVVAVLVLRSRGRRLVRESLEAQSKATHQQVELLNGIETLKSSGEEDAAVGRWSRAYTDSVNVSIRQGRLASLNAAIVGALDQAGPLLILAVGAFEVLEGSLSLGRMLAFNSLAMAALSPLASLVGAWAEVQLVGGYLERIEDVLATAPEQDPKEARAVPKLSGRIRVDKVSFRYAPDAPDVLEHIDLSVERGQCVAIVGRSGSGKSTLGRLMLGLYRPTAGRILIDDVDLASLDLPGIRRQFGVVVQNVRLFSDSIRGNIAGHRANIGMSQVIRAAKLADIHDDIMTLPMGYETDLSNAGSALSGGQRQRLSIARAVVHEPSILLLDEATSALDQLTERRVHANLTRLGCSRIVIAHRVSTIAGADLIVVVDAGRVVETGTHETLLSAGGHYAQLAQAQCFTDVSHVLR